MAIRRDFDVVVVGDLFVDLVMTGFGEFPQPGQEAFASACHRETGGGAANTSSGFAKLGMRAAIFGPVGAGEAEWFRGKLRSRGVDTSMLAEHASEPTGLTVAVSMPRDRIFYTYYGANAWLPELLATPAYRERLFAARHVHFAYPVPLAELAAIASDLHERGVTLSIDVGWQERWLDDRDAPAALAHVDWFLPNESEAQRMSGEAAPDAMLGWFARRGVAAAIKLGSCGSAARVDGAFVQVPSIEVDVKDTTGAGDCFNAGFLYGVLAGMPIPQALRLGNVCGALSTEAAGGTAGFPSISEAQRLLR